MPPCSRASRTCGARSTGSRARPRCSGRTRPDGRGLNYRDLYPEAPPPGMVPSCAEGGVLGVLCASIGSIMVTEAIKLITGIGEPLLGRLMVYDALDMSYRTIRLRRDPDARADHRTDRLRRVLRCGVRGRAGRGGRVDHHRRANSTRCCSTPARTIAIDRRARAGRVGHRAHPGRDADPEGSHPVGRGAVRAAAEQADRAALQDRYPVGRGAGRGEEGGLRRRDPSAGRRDRVGKTGRSQRCRSTDLRASVCDRAVAYCGAGQVDDQRLHAAADAG